MSFSLQNFAYKFSFPSITLLRISLAFHILCMWCKSQTLSISTTNIKYYIKKHKMVKSFRLREFAIKLWVRHQLFLCQGFAINVNFLRKIRNFIGSCQPLTSWNTPHSPIRPYIGPYWETIYREMDLNFELHQQCICFDRCLRVQGICCKLCYFTCYGCSLIPKLLYNKTSNLCACLCTSWKFSAQVGSLMSKTNLIQKAVTYCAIQQTLMLRIH